MQAAAAPEPQAQPAPRHTGRRRSLWWSTLWAFVGLLLFVGVFNFLLSDLGSNMNDFGLIALGLIFSLVPALLWLVVFYRIDSREPEPKGMVAAVFAVALLLSAALYQAVLYGLFNIDRWIYTNWWSQLLGEVLIVGALGMGIVYATVRVVVLMHPEFDERLDGIIYAMAAGLGIATVVNFNYVLQHGGVDLGIGSIRMVTNTLGYAVFAGVLGYFIGQARFETTPAWYLPGGLGIAAALTGFYFFLLDRTASDPFGGDGWRDLVLATFLAFMVLVAVGALVQRTNEETAKVAHLDAEASEWLPIGPVATVTGVMMSMNAGPGDVPAARPPRRRRKKAKAEASDAAPQAAQPAPTGDEPAASAQEAPAATAAVPVVPVVTDASASGKESA